MACDLLDFRCVFVNELIGDPLLALVLATVLYFILAGKLKLGFDTTLLLGMPIILILGLSIGAFSTIYGFATLIIAIFVSIAFNRILQNR